MKRVHGECSILKNKYSIKSEISINNKIKNKQNDLSYSRATQVIFFMPNSVTLGL